MKKDSSLINSIYNKINETPKEIVDIFKKEMLIQYDSNAPLHSYSGELMLFNCVKLGDIKKLDEQLRTMGNHYPNSGHMSSNQFLQSQFMVVSGITLITRYAIAGGLPEAEAFHLSDAYLQKLNNILTESDAIQLFLVAIHDFTRRVQKSKSHGKYSYPVARCIKYINSHICESLTLSILATECEVAPQYLSALFHKELGITLIKYIRKEKLKVAASILEDSDYSICRIANTLDFPSQSAFATQFKELYGVTPMRYRAKRCMADGK